MNAFYSNQRYSEGIHHFEHMIFPVEANPSLAELYRKVKRYSRAAQLCDEVLAVFPKRHDLFHHAWIVKRYIALHDDALFTDDDRLAQPPFGPASHHGSRYLCYRVFAGFRDVNLMAQMENLPSRLQTTRNVNSASDISRALSMLDA